MICKPYHAHNCSDLLKLTNLVTKTNKQNYVVYWILQKQCSVVTEIHTYLQPISLIKGLLL